MSLLNIINLLLIVVMLLFTATGCPQIIGACVFLLLFAAFTFVNYLIKQLYTGKSKILRFCLSSNKNLTQEQVIRELERAYLLFYALLAFLCINRMYSFYCVPSGVCCLSAKASIFAIAINIFALFYSTFAIRQLETENNTGGELAWYRAFFYVSCWHVIAFVCLNLNSVLPIFEAVWVHKIVSGAVYLLLLLIALICTEEIIVSLKLVVKLPASFEGTPLNVPFFVCFFAKEASLKNSIIKTVEERLGLDISKSETAAFFGRIFEPVLIVSLLFVWLSTSLVIVPPEKEAIFKRFGVITAKASTRPGIYFKLPWPFSTVEFYEPKRLKTLSIGFIPDPEKKDFIWTKAHSLNNFYLLTGNGVELVEIDCQVLYTIGSLYDYVSACQNPEEFISASAYRCLTKQTVSRRFNEVISQNRKELADKIKHALQTEANAAKLGIDIQEVIFLAIHPPLDVADVYEDAISAQIDKLTYVLDANTENIHRFCLHKADAKARVLQAESEAANTLAKAYGDAEAFTSRATSFNIEPELTKFRLKLDKYQDLLSSKPLFIIDKTLLREKDSLFFNFKE